MAMKWQVKVVMFHVGRSGSQVLGSLLGQHPEIEWNSEIYELAFDAWEEERQVAGLPSIPLDYENILRSEIAQSSHRVYGFEVKFFHLRVIGAALSTYLEFLKKLDFKRFIILKRKNYLRCILSSLIAAKNGQYHLELDQEPVLTKIHLDPNQINIDRNQKRLLEFMRDYDNSFLEISRLLHGEDSLNLTYEDDILGDPRSAYRKVCNFLEQNHFPTDIKFKRSNPFSIKEMLINFDEVEEILRGTDYEWMLYD